MSVAGTYCQCFLVGKAEGTECTGCWTLFVGTHVHRGRIDATASTWAAYVTI